MFDKDDIDGGSGEHGARENGYEFGNLAHRFLRDSRLLIVSVAAKARGVPLSMSKMCPEYLDADRSGRSVAADVLVREEPDDEEDDEDDGTSEDDEDQEDDEGYSE
jgi:hypothetical protein